MTSIYTKYSSKINIDEVSLSNSKQVYETLKHLTSDISMFRALFLNDIDAREHPEIEDSIDRLKNASKILNENLKQLVKDEDLTGLLDIPVIKLGKMYEFLTKYNICSAEDKKMFLEVKKDFEKIRAYADKKIGELKSD